MEPQTHRPLGPLQEEHNEPQRKRRCLPVDTLDSAIRADDVQQLERALSETPGLVNGIDGETPPLVLAIRLGHNRVAKLLLERGADVNTKLPYDDNIGTAGGTAMHIGAALANLEMVVAMATARGNLGATGCNGVTPIFIGGCPTRAHGAIANHPTIHHELPTLHDPRQLHRKATWRW